MTWLGRLRQLATQGSAAYLSAQVARALLRRRWRTATELLRRWQTVRTSGLFDPIFYAARYSQAERHDVPPLAHFVAFGATTGYAPHPAFDPGWYQQSTPEALADPFGHYLETGWRQGRSPGPLFDASFYREQAGADTGEPLSHYLRRGWRAGLRPNRVFDPAWYLRRHPDVAVAGIEPLGHFVTSGFAEGRDAAPGIPSAAYTRHHPMPDGGDPLTHLLAALTPPPATAVTAPAGLPRLDARQPAEHRRRICLVTPDLAGIAGALWSRRAAELAARGHSVTVVVLSTEPVTVDWPGVRLVGLAALPQSPVLIHGFTWFLERSWRLLRFLDGEPFDAVHLHDREAAGYWPLMAKRLGTALRQTHVTVSLCEPTGFLAEQRRRLPDDPPAAAKLDHCERFCLEQADHVVVGDAAVRDWAGRQGIALATALPDDFEDSAWTAPQNPAAQLPAAVDPWPSVTLCIPFYEHALYLDGLMAALRRLSYPHLDIVLVNDGSGPEASAAFDAAARACAGESRFHFLTVANSGPGAARNTAAAAGRGDWLVFLDADNLPCGEDFITRLAEAAMLSGADVVTAPYLAVAADVLTPGQGDVRYRFQPMGACLDVGFLDNVFGDATMIVRRSLFERVGGFPTVRRAWEDWQFLLRLAIAGARQFVYPEPLYYYRFNPAGRNETAVAYANLQSLMDELKAAPPDVLWRIVNGIALPFMAKRAAMAKQC